MTKTLGSAALQLYAGVAAMFLPIENQPGLIADLESDPFVRHALSSATCELYHRYSMFLAPLTTALTATIEETTLQSNENQETAEEPAQSPPVKRLTDKVKDPRKVAAGRARAATRKVKQEERLLEQIQAAKEPLRPPAGDDTSANIPPKEAAAVSRPEGLTNWTPWVVGARLAHVSPNHANEKTRVGSGSPC